MLSEWPIPRIVQDPHKIGELLPITLRITRYFLLKFLHSLIYVRSSFVASFSSCRLFLEEKVRKAEKISNRKKIFWLIKFLFRRVAWKLK